MPTERKLLYGRKRSRHINLTDDLERVIEDLASREGLQFSEMTRLLLVEALRARGLVKDDRKEEEPGGDR